MDSTPSYRQVGIIGSGRVAAAMALALQTHIAAPLLVWGRDPARRDALVARIPGSSAAPDLAAVARTCDLILIAVSDDAIAAVVTDLAACLPDGATPFILHLSGRSGAALLRPLQHELPADLAARLVPDLQGRDGVAILRLRFTGQGRPEGVSLQALAAMGPGATLLHGGLDRLSGHAQGSLLVSVPAGALQEEAARAALVADQIKVLGYVAADA